MHINIKKPNIFIKSLFRQLVRTLLLSVLIGVAAFFIVLRVVEYRTISRAITEAETNFRAIGYLTHGKDFLTTGIDITEAVELISQSEFVAFDNPTPRLSAILPEGMFNAAYWQPNPRIARIHPHRHLDYTYFIGVVDSISLHGGFADATVILTVCEVIGGFPEYIVRGQELSLTIQLDVVPYIELQVGGRYLMRGQQRHIALTPPQGNIRHFRMEPLNAFTNPYGSVPPMTDSRRPPEPIINNSGFIWYIELPENTLLPDYDWLGRELLYLDIGTRLMLVHGITDLSMFNYFAFLSSFLLREGRILTREDYLAQNAVVVVDQYFLYYHELAIGDFITIVLIDAHFFEEFDIFYVINQTPIDYEVWSKADTHPLTLEIVGTIFNPNLHLGGHYGSQLYIPLSLFPIGFSRAPLIAMNYSFILTSARHIDAFIAEMQPQLSPLGYEIQFGDLGAGAVEFFAASDSIMQSLTVNFFVFVGVSLAIFTLCGFIYLHQTKKNYIISRYLGVPKNSAALQRFTAILVFWLPAMVVGGVLGYYSALSQIARTLVELGV